MLSYQNKRKLRLIVNSPIFQGVLLVLTLIMYFSVYSKYSTAKEMELKKNKAAEELKLLQAKKDNLTAKIDYLNSEKGKEEELRRNFDYVNKNEKTVIIVDDKNTSFIVASGTEKEAKNNNKDKSWYEFWR